MGFTEAIEHPQENLFGAGIANFVTLYGEELPSQATIEARLITVLEGVRQRDQLSADTIAEFIRNCPKWSVFTPCWQDLGMQQSPATIAMDTYIPMKDGGIVYVCLECEQPEGSDPDATMNKQGIVAHIKDTAEDASLRLYSPYAIDRLGFDAQPGQDLIELLRLNYKRVPTVDLYRSGHTEELTIWRADPLSSDKILELFQDGEITGVSIPLEQNTEVEVASAARYISAARLGAIQEMVEEVTHGGEYLELLNQFRGAYLTNEERLAIYQRLIEIQKANGNTDPFIDWRTVIPNWFDAEGRLNQGESLWNEHVIEALRKCLIGPDGEFHDYVEAVRTRYIASLAIAAVQLPESVTTPLEIR